MAMLLRTRKNKIALGLKVFCIMFVTLTYGLLGFVFSGTEDLAQRDFFRREEPGFASRHLLSLNSTTTNSSRSFNYCTPAAINEFPPDGLTRAQRQAGWIVLHVLAVCYMFVLLAIVCDDYFVPAIKKFCDCLHMKEDIAGATFMAMASSSPELFINCVGTFVTEGDIGVGTIVGSAVFNILAVTACCGLFANSIVYLDWWSLSRDSMMYGISVILLITFLQDGRIYLYEALTLLLVYIIYILIMIFNNFLMNSANRLVTKCRRKNHYIEIIAETTPLLTRNGDKFENGAISEILDTEFTLKDCEDLEESTKIWEYPSDQSGKGQAWWIATWPISFLLYLTTPDCRKYPRLYVVTFIMCICWIGMTSYVISWLITVIGDTLRIPDSVMGLTFLAAGMSVPEAVSSVIVTNQGHGSMGLSSSIGSNTFDILLCLGLPWLIKTSYHPKFPGKNWIKINSAGLNYSAISLLSTLVLFYLSIAFNKFILNWKVGVSCLLMYVAFLVSASLIELNFFFPVNPPTCYS